MYNFCKKAGLKTKKINYI